MNKVFTLFLFLGLIFQNSYAQTEEKDTLDLSSKKNLMPYISITSPFEKYSSFDVGFSKPTKNGNAIGIELGYIYDIDVLNTEIDDSWYQSTYGTKAYFYYRIIIKENDPYPFNSKTFIDIEPQFFWANLKSEKIAGYSCNEEWGDCEYYRFFDSRVDRIIPGLNFKVGKIYNYDAFNFILFAGIGVRYVIELSDIMNDPKPDKIFNRNGEIDNFFNRNGGFIDLRTGTMLNLRIGFQVAYNLGS